MVADMSSPGNCVDVMSTVNTFREFLNSSWPAVETSLESLDWDDDVYFLEDWIDSNWQLLVARPLLGKNGSLQPFGAAGNDIKSRRFNCWLQSINGGKIFQRLGTYSKQGKLLCVAPPFDLVEVMCQDGSGEIVPWGVLEFELAAKK